MIFGFEARPKTEVVHGRVTRRGRQATREQPGSAKTATFSMTQLRDANYLPHVSCNVLSDDLRTLSRRSNKMPTLALRVRRFHRLKGSVSLTWKVAQQGLPDTSLYS